MTRNQQGAAPAGFAAFALVVFTGLMASPGAIRADQAQSPPAQAAAPQQATGDFGRGQQQAAGGGRRDMLKPSADLYANTCAGCHGGADGSAGRATPLLSDTTLKNLSDEQIVAIVRHGIPGTAMAAFPKEVVSDDQLFNLTFYLRSTAASIKPKTQFVADPNGAVLSTEKQNIKIEVLSKDLVTPFGMAFLPDGRLLVTERPGRIRIFDKGTLSAPVANTPKARVQQDGGYLDITVHPDYAKNGWIYLSYSEVQPGWTPPAPPAAPAQPTPSPAGRPGQGPPIPSNTVIVRGKIKNNEWTEQQVIFRSPEALYSPRGEHYGSRFTWDKQHHLFFSLGERGNMVNAQTLTDKNSLGKIHRINDDGTAPKDNPFVATLGADPTVWSYGHRNPQGLAFSPLTGRLWETEHGPVGGDEVNVIEPGKNYGWGVTSMGIQPGITERSHAGMEQPIVYYTPSAAPSGISFYTGARYPQWKNNSLFVGFLVGQQLRRLEINGDKVTHQEVVFEQFGRVHDIVQGPDGYLYLLLQDPTGVNGISLSADTPGRLIRLLPN